MGKSELPKTGLSCKRVMGKNCWALKFEFQLLSTYQVWSAGVCQQVGERGGEKRGGVGGDNWLELQKMDECAPFEALVGSQCLANCLGDHFSGKRSEYDRLNKYNAMKAPFMVLIILNAYIQQQLQCSKRFKQTLLLSAYSMQTDALHTQAHTLFALEALRFLFPFAPVT